MNKYFNFVKLDLITIKPYLTGKNMLIFASVFLFIAFTNKSASAITGIGTIIAFIYSSYPFALSEKSNLDALYITLAIPDKTVVAGRYIFSLLLGISGTVLSCTIAYAVSFFFDTPLDPTQTLASVSVLLLVFILFQAIQNPIYFKLGYSKAKPIVYLPLFLLSGASIFFSKLIKDGPAGGKLEKAYAWISAHPFIAIMGALILLVMILMVSYSLSIRFYRKKEF